MKKLYAALMTAFDENGNIDEQGTREMVRYNIDVNQLDGLYVGGSTGENSCSGSMKRSACLRSQWMKLRAQISI